MSESNLSTLNLDIKVIKKHEDILAEIFSNSKFLRNVKEVDLHLSSIIGKDILKKFQDNLGFPSISFEGKGRTIFPENLKKKTYIYVEVNFIFLKYFSFDYSQWADVSQIGLKLKQETETVGTVYEKLEKCRKDTLTHTLECDIIQKLLKT